MLENVPVSDTHVGKSGKGLKGSGGKAGFRVAHEREWGRASAFIRSSEFGMGVPTFYFLDRASLVGPRGRPKPQKKKGPEAICG